MGNPMLLLLIIFVGGFLQMIFEGQSDEVNRLKARVRQAEIDKHLSEYQSSRVRIADLKKSYTALANGLDMTVAEQDLQWTEVNELIEESYVHLKNQDFLKTGNCLSRAENAAQMLLADVISPNGRAS